MILKKSKEIAVVSKTISVSWKRNDLPLKASLFCREASNLAKVKKTTFIKVCRLCVQLMPMMATKKGLGKGIDSRPNL